MRDIITAVPLLVLVGPVATVVHFAVRGRHFGVGRRLKLAVAVVAVLVVQVAPALAGKTVQQPLFALRFVAALLVRLRLAHVRPRVVSGFGLHAVFF